MTTKQFTLGEDELELRCSRSNRFIEGNIVAVLRTESSHLAFSRLFLSLFILTDTLCAGLISTEAVAAITLAFPFFYVIGVMLSPPRAVSVERTAACLGRDDLSGAGRYAAAGISISFGGSLIFSLLTFLFAPMTMRFLGNDPVTSELAVQYLQVAVLSIVPGVLGHQFSSALSAGGHSVVGRNWSVTSVVLNAILDFWFVFGGLGVPPLGIQGIALASVISSLIGAVFLGRRLALMFPGLFTRSAKADIGAASEILKTSGPLFASSVCFAVTGVVPIFILARLDSAALAAFGAVTNLLQLLTIPGQGVAPAVLYLVSQNFASGQIGRIRKCWLAALFILIPYLVPALLLSVFFADVVLVSFLQDSRALGIATICMPILFASEAACLIIPLNGNALIGMGRFSYSALFDAIWGAVPASLVALFAWKWQAVGVFWALAVGDVVVAIVSMIFVAHNLEHLRRKQIEG